jgi:TP901 family phage tail tape measure protein
VADAQRTIDLIFNGVDKTGLATQAAISNTKAFSSNIQSATQPIANFTQSLVKIEAAVLSAGAVIGAFAISEAASFQSSVAELNKVLGEGENIQNYINLAEDLAKTYGIASEEVLGTIANYKQAGFSAKEAGELTKAGLDLVIAGGLEAGAAGEILVSSLKGFGASATEAAGFVDLINQVSNEYATNVEELGLGFAAFSPIARNTGFSIQETVAVLTPGIEVFRSGSEVARGLRTSFLNLTSDLPRVKEALATLGVAQKDANGELRSARDIYFDVAESLLEVDQNQRAYLATQIAGKDQAGKFLATVEGLDKSLRIAGEGFNFAGSAAKEVEIQLATAERAADRVKVNFQELFKAIGTPLLDEFSGVADGLSAIFNALGENLDEGGLGELSAFIEENLQSLADTFQEVAANLPAALAKADFSPFIDGLQSLGDSFNNLFNNIDITSEDGLVSAVELLAAAFGGLSQFSAGVVDSLKPLFDLFSDLASGASDASIQFREIGKSFGFITQINAFAGAVGAAIPVLQGLGALVAVNQAGSVVSGLNALGSSLSGKTGVVANLGKLGALSTSFGAGFGLGKLADAAVELGTGTSLSDRLSDWLTSLTGLNDQAELLGQTLRPTAEQSAKAIADLDAEMTSVNNNLAQSVDFWGEFGNESGQIVGTIENLDDIWLETQQAIKDTTAATQELVKETDSISLEEKLALIEANSQIATAQITADANTLSSAFESVGTSVTETSDLLGDLFGLLGDENISKFDKLDIKNQIADQAKLQEDLLKTQQDLVKAQTRELNARTRAFKNGGALINVDGAGLQPHLEAFMFEILEAIQVRVNAQGYNLLLGLG